MAQLWGIDLGGTKIEGAILDPARPGEPLCRLRLPTESEYGYDHILGQIAQLCQKMSAETGLPLPPKIGMGTPGTVDPRTHLLRGSNTQCLNGRPLGRDIEKKLSTSFACANDANCFALAEAAWGAARGYETVFGIIMGTGVGAGIVVKGQVLNGCHGIAGEWGQLVLDPSDAPSAHGTHGTVEAFICGPGLERFYAQQSGAPAPLKEIVLRAETGDPHAQATLERLTTRFAEGLAKVIDILDPHAIVIGGGVGNIDALYRESTRSKIADRIFAPAFSAALLKPALGDSAGVFGAAMLVA
jgi:fructokinase